MARASPSKAHGVLTRARMNGPSSSKAHTSSVVLARRRAAVCHGPGVAVDAQDKLFTHFTRLEKVGQSQGLGLAIVRRIVEKLGGEVGVERKEGQGSLFYFTLPAFRVDS